MVRYAFVVALVLSSTAVVHADDGVALEVYVGDRPRDAERTIPPMLTELGKAKIASADTVGKMVNSTLSSPSRTDKGLPSNFVAEALAGEALWAHGQFTEAIAKLSPLITDAHDNSGAFAKDTGLREPLLKAMIALALSHSGAGDLGSMRTTFEEIVRSFPGFTVASSVYGPDASKAFEQARKGLARQGTGKLSVRVQTGVVFVDETYRGSGTTTIDVPPGDYRIVVIANDQPSRTHLVSVQAGSERTVVVDAAFDQAVHTGSWTGFSFANAEERDKHAGPYAAQLARAIGAKSVMLVGVDQGKKPQVFGSIISLDSGNAIRGATVALEPDPSRDLLKSLARYLVGDAAAPGLEIVDPKAVALHVDPEKHDGEVAIGATTTTVDTRRGGWRWLSLTATVGLAGTGAVLYALNGHCKTDPPQGRTCTDIYQNSPVDKVALIAAIPFAAATIYLFATQTKSVEYRTAFLAPTKNGAIAGYAFTW
ncbi:MAG: hypothetical protein ABI678_18230 [Kofleriaceae bacterium]